VVLAGAQVAAARAHGAAGGEFGVGLFEQTIGERRPLPVPAVAVARGDPGRDEEALADVRHARVALADRALQLTVEVVVVEEQLHRDLLGAVRIFAQREEGPEGPVRECWSSRVRSWSSTGSRR
jgi:hypothetical protein